jgi:hypothetical protein
LFKRLTQEEYMEQQPPLSLFKSRVYDLLENRDKLQPASAIGTLSRADSALCAALSLAAEQFQLDTAHEIAVASFDGIALTLLAVYNNGLPPGAKMTSKAMQQVAEILSNAGEYDRAKTVPEDRSDDAERGDQATLSATGSDAK